MGLLNDKQVFLSLLKGDSAYQVAVRNGFKGTEEEWLASLRQDAFIVDSTGTASDKAMSQKAVTDELDAINSKFIVSEQNLLDTSNLKDGYIDTSTGLPQSGTQYSVDKYTDFIPVKPNTVYYRSYSNVFLYDANFAFIERAGGAPGVSSFTTTETTAYARMSFRSAYEDLTVAFLSSVRSKYAPFQVSVDHKLIRLSAGANIQDAINKGYNVIVLEAGKYPTKAITIDGLNKIQFIVPEPNTNVEAREPKKNAVIDNSIDLEATYADGMVTAPFKAATSSRWYKVFVSKVYTPIRTGLRSETYNAILWETDTANSDNDRKLLPVLSLEECQSTDGSFFYDHTNGIVHINPYDYKETTVYKRLAVEEGSLFVAKNLNELYMENIEVKYAADVFELTNISNCTVRNCVASHTAWTSAFSINGVNGSFHGCEAYKACADGFGIGGKLNGYTEFYDCHGHHNYDDGISHHNGSEGAIYGGDWHHNVKGGVAPAHGSVVNCYNVISHDNGYGFYVESDSTVPSAMGREVKYSGCTAYNNNFGISVLNYHVVACNCSFEKNTTPTKVISDDFTSLTTVEESNSTTDIVQTAELDRLYDKASMIMAESRNLFDGYIIPDTVIDSVTGMEKHSDAYRTTRYIEVEPSQIYTLFGWSKYSFYDADHNYLTSAYTRTSGRATMTTPDNCKYVRLGTDTTNLFEQQMYKGDVDASKTTYKPLSLRSEYLPKSVVMAQNNTGNLFNGVVVEKTSIDATTGAETPNDEYRTSEYISVIPSAFYTAHKWNAIAFYKKDYTFHSRKYCVSEPIVQIPDGCYYVRLSTSITKRDQMFLKGAYDGFYYLPYKETIPADMVERQIWKDETYFYDRMAGYFNAPEQEAFNPTASERTVESIYGIYDALVTAYPDYVTKTDLGLDQMGRYHIYRYDFKPESPRVPELDAVKNKHLPKIIIFSGVHGLERWSIYAIAQLMKLICTNPNNDPILEHYRQGIEFIVVPLVNPWGYVEGTRWNSRGVNINRNLSSGWKVSGSEAFTIDYEGTNAFSEAESSIVKKLLEENLDAFAVIDAHTHDITEWDKTYWCVASTGTHFYRDGIAIARNIVAKISKHLKSDYKQDFEGFAGYVEGAPAGGGVASYAVMRCGLNGMTAEVVDKLVGEPESGTPLTNQVNVEFYANLIAEIIKYYQ